VADRQAIGTTLYTAPYDVFDPHFGRRSRQAHLDSGAHEITLAVESLRLDVDDARDLAAAETVGLGAHTRLALLG
jgi:2-phospho-L-lactate guanylyltransferase